MGYLGLVVGAALATLLGPKAAAEAFRRGRRSIERLRGRRGAGPSSP